MTAEETASRAPGSLSCLKCLLPNLPRDVTPSLLLVGHSGIQLQVSDVFLGPGLPGVGTDLPLSFGLESAEKVEGLHTEECSRGTLGPP